MKTLRLGLFIALLLGTLTVLQAQKYGYLNSAQLLLEMPEIKTADDQLSTYQEGLLQEGENMVAVFQQNFQKYQADRESGELSPLEIQQREGDLSKEQQSIQNYELEVQRLLIDKREELYKPILDKVKNALDELGKEQGFTMIFDTSTGGLLHANQQEDVMPLIKSKLGI